MSVDRDGKHMVFHGDVEGGRALYNAVVSVAGK